MEKIRLPQAAFEVEIVPHAGENLTIFLQNAQEEAVGRLELANGTVQFTGNEDAKTVLRYAEGDSPRVFWEIYPKEQTCRVLAWNPRAEGPPVSVKAGQAAPAFLKVCGKASVYVREELAPVLQKRAGVLYQKRHMQAAIANAKRRPFAMAMQKSLVLQADYWRKLSYAQLWEKMFQPATATRSLMVWSDGYCPCCQAKIGLYAWETDPKNHPWKVFCPFCREMFPKNDFWAFHTSGINPQTGLFDRAQADKTLLYNTGHPDPSDPLHKFGVDDGSGYTDGKNRWYFTGYYLYRGAWYQDILEGVNRLSEAFLVTGDVGYATRTLILLDRIADFFPDFEYFSQGLVYEKPTVTGYITYCIDSAYDVLHMALAYDRVFDAVQGDESAAAFLASQAARFPDNPVTRKNPKKTFAQIQENIETRLFRHALAHVDRIRTNYPSTDLTAVTVRAVLGWPSQREAVLDRIAIIAETSTFVDGTAGEKGLPNYTAFPAQRMAKFLAEFAKISDDFLANLLERCPRLSQTWRFFAETMCLDGFYPHLGDAGEFARREGVYRGMLLWNGDENAQGIFRLSPIPSLHGFLWRLYEITGDVTYVKIMVQGNKNKTEGLPYDIFSEHNEAIEQAAARLIAAYGRDFAFGSVNKTEYHLALLRAKNDESPVCWLAYDAGGKYGHSHKNGMHLGLYGFGLDLLTDFGYPPVNKDGWQGPWTAWYQGTFSHNTVVVDGKNQRKAEGETVFFQGEGPVRAVCAKGEAMYDNTKRYERTLIQCDLDEGGCYIVDVFRVEGGKRHDKFLSTQYATLSTKGLSLHPTENPWAGEEACATCLANVRRDESPQEGWQATFAIQDQDENAPKDVFVRHTELTKGAAYVFDAWVQKSFDDPVEAFIPRIAASRMGEDGLCSAFVSVLEPYRGKPGLHSIRRLPLTGADGLPLSEAFVAVEVALASGERELVVVNDAPGQTVCQPDWAVETDSALLVLRRQPGGVFVRAEVKY